MSIEAMKQALEKIANVNAMDYEYQRWAREALAIAEPAQQEKHIPITDDYGKAIQYQYRVIEQRGNWFLLYDQHQIGNAVIHEFRIQKLKHDIALYRGISLEDAKQRFHEKVEADYE